MEKAETRPMDDLMRVRVKENKVHFNISLKSTDLTIVNIEHSTTSTYLEIISKTNFMENVVA